MMLLIRFIQGTCLEEIDFACIYLYFLVHEINRILKNPKIGNMVIIRGVYEDLNCVNCWNG